MSTNPIFKKLATLNNGIFGAGELHTCFTSRSDRWESPHGSDYAIVRTGYNSLCIDASLCTNKSPVSKTLPFMWPENVGKAVNIIVCSSYYCSTRRWLAELKTAFLSRRPYWFPFLRHNKSRREERYVFITRQNSKGFTVYGITARKRRRYFISVSWASSRKSVKTPDSVHSISQILVYRFCKIFI